MANLLRVLILEDSQSDTMLLLRELRRLGYDVKHQRVETSAEMAAALDNATWDVILSDYSMPGFGAHAGLTLVQEKGIDVPFIIVSGTIGEDTAVEMMKVGAHDFFVKGNLTRLGPAIARELRESEERQKRWRAELELRLAEERFSQAFHANPNPICISTLAEGKVLDANLRFRNLFDLQREEIVGQEITTLGIWADSTDFWQLVSAMRRNNGLRNAEVQLHSREQGIRDTLVSLELIDLSGEPCVLTMIHDITERKQAENELVALYNATAFLFNADNLLDLGQQIVQAVVEEFGQLDCGLILVDKQQKKLIRLARTGAQQVQTEAPLYVDGPGLVAEVVRSGQMIYAADVTTDPRYTPNAPQTRSELAIPLRTAKGILGVLDLQRDQPDAFSPQDQRILSAFAERAGAAIEIMSLYEEINRHAADLEWRVAKRTVELHNAKSRSEAIFNSSSDAIVLIDSDKVVQQTNPSFNKMFGYQADEITGRSLMQIIAPDQIGVLEQTIQIVMDRKQQERVELVALRKDVTSFNVDIALSPVTDYDTLRSSVVCNIRDITERTQLEKSLRQALAKEKELNELKSRFTSMVSHEFRTPLSVIQMSSNIFRKYSGRLSDERRTEHLNKIDFQIKRLIQLLDNILTIGKAEAVGLVFQPETLNLEKFCRQMVEEIQLVAENHQIDFSATGDCAQAFLDSELLRQIISNLLSNAIKYSPEGGSIRFALVCENQQGVLSIQDQGVGIPQEDQERLFQNFHRATNVGNIPGTGLGLAIVKRAVDAHGGTIRVKSEIDKGTTFTITIPMASSPAT
jgi:PAS domain S-box-containing protein